MRNAVTFMRVTIGVLLAVLVLTIWSLVAERATNSDLRRQLLETTVSLNDKNRPEQLELQEKCAQRAEQAFRSMGYKLQSDSLQSHYHLTKGRCFMIVAPAPSSNPDGTIFIFKYLLDAYEGKSLAEYAWRSRTDKSYSEVPPAICKLTPFSTQESSCHSDAEFEKFASMYME